MAKPKTKAKDEPPRPSQPSVPTRKPNPANSDNPKSKSAATSQSKGASTARVSEKPQPSQPGPDAKDVRSKKKSTDTRGSKQPTPRKRAKPGTDEWPHGKPAEDQVPTAAETAAKQPIRANSDLPAPVETLKVKGEKVEVEASPTSVDPVEQKPSRRDTLIKDALRTEGKPELADAPTREPQGGDWHLEDPKLG